MVGCRVWERAYSDIAGGGNTGQLRVRIDDEWYDLSRWRKAHPAGTHWIDLYKVFPSSIL